MYIILTDMWLFIRTECNIAGPDAVRAYSDLLGHSNEKSFNDDSFH